MRRPLIPFSTFHFPALILCWGLLQVEPMLGQALAERQDQDKPAESSLQAGAATANITPPLGELIVGGWTPTPATHVHDELHARALVLDDGETRLAIVLCDNVGIPREVFDLARTLASEATGLPPENLLLAATHTHSATTARGPKPLVNDGDLSAYQKFLAGRVADVIQIAIANLEPAKIGWGTVDVPGQVFNRRWFLRPGTPNPNPFGGADQVRMNPPRGHASLLEPAGPTDPQVSFLSVQSAEGRPLALLANYSLHYVGGVAGPTISADYFAVFADRIQKLLEADRQDPPFVGIMSNGTSGDINNVNFREPSPSKAPFEKMREVAFEVADAVFEAHQSIEFQDLARLGAAWRELPLAVRKPTAEQLKFAKEVLERPEGTEPGHIREVNYAERVLLLHESPDEVSVPIQALRIGNLGISAIPFEVFVESGLEIKEKGPFEHNFTISLANGSYGYLPTPRHHKLGGYETWLGTSRVEVQAAPKIVSNLLEMLGELQDEASGPEGNH